MGTSLKTRPSIQSRRLLLTLALGASLLNCGRGATPRGSNEALDLRPLLDATKSPEAAAALDRATLLGRGEALTKADPVWPVHTFLLGEAHRLRREGPAARSAYRALAEWAATNPNGDGWGGCALAGVALWRWLEALGLEATPDPGEAARLLDVAEKLRKTRLFRRLFSDPLFSNMPRLEEDILRRLALLAWSAGKQADALRLFLDYLSIASTVEMGPIESQLRDRLVSSGLASRDRLTLFRGKRFVSLRMNDDAYAMLTEAASSKDAQVRAEAGLYLARMERIRGAPRDRVVETLSSVIDDATDPDVAQHALLDRARLLYREGRGRDVEQSLQNFLRLVNGFPRGPLVDDALYELARYYQNAGDLEQALAYFARLRSLPEPNAYVNLAAFQPAIALYTRGSPEDLAKAAALLEELEKQQPSGPLHPNVLFWLGRIAAERGDEQQARSLYQRLIDEAPYDFYAIRAHMHLRRGKLASRELWPDESTVNELRVAYQRSWIDTSLAGNSAYHSRLRHALKTGLYAAALAADRRLREAFPSRRMEELSLKELDDAGLLSHLVLWLALRQDALAAKDALPSVTNRLQIAGAVGQSAQDWPAAITLAIGLREPYEARVAAQRDPRYLVTAYPAVFEESIRKSGAAYNVKPGLLYSIIRHESLFYPAALSEKGALGLFQFTPTTFRQLDQRWQLLRSSGARSPAAFLLDRDLSIDLGARFLQAEFLSRQRGNILLALMEHNAGIQAVREWVAEWKSIGRDDDIEYVIETTRFLETRIFVRGALTSLVIAEAAGLLKANREGRP